MVPWIIFQFLTRCTCPTVRVRSCSRTQWGLLKNLGRTQLGFLYTNKYVLGIWIYTVYILIMYICIDTVHLPCIILRNMIYRMYTHVFPYRHIRWWFQTFVSCWFSLLLVCAGNVGMILAYIFRYTCGSNRHPIVSIRTPTCTNYKCLWKHFGNNYNQMPPFRMIKVH